MEAIRTYLLRIIAAALICAIVSALIGKKGLLPKICHLICSVFLTLVLISPLTNLRLTMPEVFAQKAYQDAEEIVQTAQLDAKNQIADIIKAETEAYILDKANKQGIQISVEVKLNDEDYPIPVGSHIRGDLSPYHKKMLSDMLANDLGIAAEDQKWN